MTEEDLGLALKQRMTRAADDIAASPEVLDNVRRSYRRRRRHQTWALAAAAMVAAVAIVVPITLTGGGTSTVSTHAPKASAYKEPDWARRCFERQGKDIGVPLQPAPQFVGLTVLQVWRTLRGSDVGAIVAWNGKCIGFGVEGRPLPKLIYIAVVGDGDPLSTKNPMAAKEKLRDRVVAARVVNP